MVLPIFLLFSFISITQACNQIDHDTLLSISQNLSTTLSSPPLNWSSSNSIECCSWEGVSCDDSNNRVVGISLPHRGLKGQVSPFWKNLTFLTYLNLSRNCLSGPLPDALFRDLGRLQTVDLSSNRLSGELGSFGTLPTSIQIVDLSGNQLNGTISNLFLKSAGNLTSLNVRNNSLSGTIPSSICATSPSIKFLDFSVNDFEDQIPNGFGICSKLEILRASSNKLKGLIPVDIYSATSLQEIFLPANELSGTLDERVVNLTNLRVLNVFGNHFVGVIPSNIGELSTLEELQLHINNFTGNLPESLTNCTNLKILNLRVNKLYGKLSDLDFSRFSKLNTLDLGNNNFTGNLPETLFSCKSLVAVRLTYNSLVGEISPNIAGLQSLSFLSISVNNLTNVRGAISALAGCKNLTTLALSKNFYYEELPDDVDFLDEGSFQNIKVLALGACQMAAGQVPNWLVKLKKLEVLDLSYNQMKGPIPDWLGNISNLFYLDFSYNQLNGGFPMELTQLPRLTSQREINESILELPVFVNPNNISLLQYNQLNILPPTMNLQNNNLSGNIPVEVGLMNSLHALDLSCNNFSGDIPDQLSNLTNLETLNLSVNKLSGQIPSSLKGLHFLSSFSVANNNLQGPIPTGGQFDTFPNTSFAGNPMLCGSVIHKSCSLTPDTGRPSRPSKKSPKKKIVTGLVIGICLGIGFTLITLAICILSKGSFLSRGKSDKVNADTISLRSNSGISTEFGKDASLVMVFPSNTADIKNLSIYEILKATDNFNQENIIGCGGFGLVYKATLENGTKLAIKKLSGDMGLMEREFRAEVEALSTAQHKNLVTLQGYCIHDGFRILMYSYMENGSLDYWLHENEGGAQLDWPTRLRILQGAGCGLAYMHQICEPHIVHRDIKSSNILLDDKFEAHVADFGLSRMIQPYHTHVTTELVGTLGYIPPEYGQAWIATLRGDMYSFGVVMLELLTRKRPVEVFKPKVSRELVVWVQQLRSQGRQNELFDPFLKGKGFEEEMTQVLDVACMCVNENPFKRPTITEVVDWLENVGANRETPKE